MKIVILRGAAGEQGITAIGSDDGSRWVLVNVSSSVAQQLASGEPALPHPALAKADVRAVLITDAQIEHVGGLLGLRAGAPIDLYATPAVFEELTTELPVLPVLQHYCGVHWRVVAVAGDDNVATFQVEGMPELEFTAIATRVPAPPHAAHRRAPVVGDSIALAVRDRATGQRVFCAPGLSRFGPQELAWMHEADCVLFDAGDADADDLPPLPAAARKVVFGAQPADSLAAQGIEPAYDGMEITL